MKKLLTIATLFVVVMGVLAVSVNAATADSVNAIYAIGSKYGMTADDKQHLQNFLDRNGFSETQAQGLIARAQEAENYMKSTGKTNYKDLTGSEMDGLKAIANEAASDLGVSLVFKKGAVEVWKDGKQIDTFTKDGGKAAAYTGSKLNIAVIAVSSVAVIALAAVVLKKRTAVAE